MRSGRSVLGVIAGVLLGLGVVALAGPGFSLYGAQFSGLSSQPARAVVNSVQTVTTTISGVTVVYSMAPETAYSTTGGLSSSPGQQGQNSTASVIFGSTDLAQVSNIAKQPATLTGFALLPVFAALVFGFALYRVYRGRDKEEESPESV